MDKIVYRTRISSAILAVVNGLRGPLTKSGTYKSNVASICRISLQRLYSTEIIKANRPNYYYVLGISPSATQAEIKASYYRLCKKYHPDVIGSSLVDHNKFTEITEAYSVLASVELRRKYDRSMMVEHGYPAHSTRSKNNPRPTMHSSSRFDRSRRADYASAYTLKRNDQSPHAAKEATDRMNQVAAEAREHRRSIWTVMLLILILAPILTRIS